jgi:hypothetical protein
MPRQDLMELVLQQFAAGREQTLEGVVVGVRKTSPVVSEADVRSAVLGLLRRNELQLTDQFNLQQASDVVAA